MKIKYSLYICATFCIFAINNYHMRKLTNTQVEYITTHYPNSYAQDIADKLGLNVSTIYNCVHSRNIKKSEEWMKMELNKQANRLKKDGVRHRFSKGHTPTNKGQKMAEGTYSKVKATMFSKGNLPHNTQPVGTETQDKDGYIKVKYALHKWKHKHILIWEEKNGPLQKGEMVKFKDGNKYNLTIDNLYKTTRKANMLDNTIQRYPAELKSAIRLVGKLKRTITNNKNQQQDEKQN